MPYPSGLNWLQRHGIGDHPALRVPVPSQIGTEKFAPDRRRYLDQRCQIGRGQTALEVQPAPDVSLTDGMAQRGNEIRQGFLATSRGNRGPEMFKGFTHREGGYYFSCRSTTILV